MSRLSRFSLTREQRIHPGSIKVSDKLSDAVAYLDSNERGPCVMVFYGKQSKPIANYRCRSEAERAALVKRYFEARQAHTARIVADRTSPSAVAVRNRAIKTLLEDEYGKGNVKVTGDRGTAYGWVNVRINAPGPKGEAEKNGIERKILKAGIKLGHYDSGDYGSGYELSVRFGQENA